MWFFFSSFSPVKLVPSYKLKMFVCFTLKFSSIMDHWILNLCLNGGSLNLASFYEHKHITCLVCLKPIYVSLWDPESMKFSHILERSPRDWETTMRQNVVLTVFHTQNICHSVWKTLRTTFWCFIFLQSQGEGLKGKKNFVPEFSLLFKPSPRDWRKTKHQSKTETAIT